MKYTGRCTRRTRVVGAPGDVPGPVALGVGAASSLGWTTLGMRVSAPESEMVIVWAGATPSGPRVLVPWSATGMPWLGAPHGVVFFLFPLGH